MHNPPRILIVDDNETNRDILLTRLGTHGYDLVQAADGEEAIEVARKSLPDLILLDVMMPKLDGIEVTKRLKADQTLPFMPIILVTAKADTKDVVAGLDAGADEYLTKPVDQMALVARVKSMLRVKELHDKVAAQAADLASWNKTLEQRVADQLSRSNASTGSSAFSRRRSPTSSCRRATRRCSKATAARSPWCSATCAASRRSPRPPSPRRSWPCCASITRASAS